MKTKASKPAPRERARRTADPAPAEESPRARRQSAAPREAEAPARNTRRAASNGNDELPGYTGEDIYAQFEREDQRADERAAKRASGMGYINRFWMKQGEEREIVLLDESIKKGFAVWEHNVPDSTGKFGKNFHLCCKEYGHCPLCEQHGDSYFVLMLSALDLTGFTTRKGRKVEQSKVLLPIKRSQFHIFQDIEKAVLEKHGTLRGTYLVLRRAKGDTTPSIGEPAMLKGGVLFDHYTEKQIASDFGHDAVKGDDGKVIRPADFDITPFPWRELFKKPDPEEMARQHGGRSQPGSRREADEEWGADNNRGNGGDAEGERQPRRPAAASRRGAAQEDAGQGEDDPLARRPRRAR